jgi:signal peptidase
MDSVVNPTDGLKCGLAAELLRSRGELRLQVTGTSMIPAVWPGDVLLVRREGATEARAGDVILFGRDGRLFAHRVVRRAEGPGGPIWITRGDRHRHDDPPVSGEELLGRVTAILRADALADPRLTPGLRIAAFFLRRSWAATRLVAGLRHRWRGDSPQRKLGTVPPFRRS